MGRSATGKADEVYRLYGKQWPHSCIAAKLNVTEPYVYQTLKYSARYEDFSVMNDEINYWLQQSKTDQFIQAEIGVPLKYLREYRTDLISQHYPRSDELIEALLISLTAQQLYEAVSDDLLDKCTLIALNNCTLDKNSQCTNV